MKFSILALAAVVSLSSAQNLSGEPACATSCLLSAISAASCAPTDVSCQCNLAPAAVAGCLAGACSPDDVQIAYTVGTNLCKSFSATANGTISTTGSSNGTTSSGVLSTSKPYSNTTTVTAKTTSFTSTKTTGAGGSKSTPPSPTSTSSKAAAPALVAGIGGVVGMLGLVAAL